MSKHTPGAWSIHEGEEYSGVRIDADNGRAVAHAIQRNPHPTLGQGITQKEAESNGRLIAAAPDLLAALVAAHAMICAECADGAHTKVAEQATAAIAKATGAK